ncbi:MAG: 2OG-Fe(II) oxygenase [Steroidobacteraceae bacterium]
MSAAAPLRRVDAIEESVKNSIADCVAALDPAALDRSLDRDGFAVTPPFVDALTCAQLAQLYDASEETFRSTVSMERYGFGNGEYKYFARPLPVLVTALREALYERLAPIANAWSERLGDAAPWPANHRSLVARCAAAGQTRPTPLLLRYAPGDYNCLHQDLYGDIHFPLQAILLLDRPGFDFEGGELILVEQRPRRQSRPMVVPLTQGAIAVIPVKERPVQGVRGTTRVQMRHGVSKVHRGLRRTLGLIFHDAA